MSGSTFSSVSSPSSYWQVSRAPRYSLLFALPLLVFLGFLLRPSLLDNNHAWIALAIAFGTLVLLALILVVTGHPKLAGRF